MKNILSVITFMVVSHYSSGQPLSAICAARGYSAHDTDCDKFIQCRYIQEGVLQGEIRQCAFSTYWNDEDWTCTPASYTYCPTDKCQGQLNGMQYKAEGNCRGYWNCMDGKSVATCCPQGQYYNETFGCIDNDDANNCTVTCLNDIVVAENETVMEEPCAAKIVPGDPTKYQLELPGYGLINMPCGHGTVFDEVECGCISATLVNKPKCTPEVFLPFDADGRDMSGKKNHVGNENVIIENGVARFNGKNSQLIIPRFNNIEHVSTIVIKVNYTSDHTKPGLARAIISNSGNCSSRPSVLLSEDSTNSYFGVGTTNSTFVYSHLAHDDMMEIAMYSQKSVVYKYNGVNLSGSNGNGTTEVPVSGYIRNVHCPFYVGFAKELAPFEGEIDSLEIYLCDPDLQ